MQPPQILEGTWEEIKRHEEMLTGRFLRVIVEPDKEQAQAITDKNSPGSERDPALVARVKSGRGKFAHTRTTPLLASEELHLERQADKEKSERRIKGYYP